MPEFVWIILLAPAAYMFGNINFARIIARAKRLDITKEGSGNPGTMNVLRVLGFKYGLLVFFLDILKGGIPCLLSAFLIYYGGTSRTGTFILPTETFIGGSKLCIYVAGLSVILGHMYPVAYRFKGGKSVASAIGVFLVSDWRFMLLVIALGILALLIWNYGSVASFVCMTSMTIIEYVKLFVWDNSPLKFTLPIAILLGIMYMLIIVAHRGNIMRLIKGTERKVSLFGKRDKRSRTEPPAGA